MKRLLGAFVLLCCVFFAQTAIAEVWVDLDATDYANRQSGANCELSFDTYPGGDSNDAVLPSMLCSGSTDEGFVWRFQWPEGGPTGSDGVAAAVELKIWNKDVSGDGLSNSNVCHEMSIACQNKSLVINNGLTVEYEAAIEPAVSAAPTFTKFSLSVQNTDEKTWYHRIVNGVSYGNPGVVGALCELRIVRLTADGGCLDDTATDIGYINARIIFP